MSDELDLPSIHSFFVCSPECPVCLGQGHVCEDHPDRPWAGIVGDVLGCACGAPGMPCPSIEQARDVFTEALMGALTAPVCMDCLALLPANMFASFVGGPPRCEAHR